MTPLKVRARVTESWSENSTKAKRVGWVSSPAILTNRTSPTCLKNSSSCSAVVVFRRININTRIEPFLKATWTFLCHHRSEVQCSRHCSVKQGQFCVGNLELVGLFYNSPRNWNVASKFTFTYLWIQVADIDGPSDLIDFRRINIANEWRLWCSSTDSWHRCLQTWLQDPQIS